MWRRLRRRMGFRGVRLGVGGRWRGWWSLGRLWGRRGSWPRRRSAIGARSGFVISRRRRRGLRAGCMGGGWWSGESSLTVGSVGFRGSARFLLRAWRAGNMVRGARRGMRRFAPRGRAWRTGWRGSRRTCGAMDGLPSMDRGAARPAVRGSTPGVRGRAAAPGWFPRGASGPGGRRWGPGGGRLAPFVRPTLANIPIAQWLSARGLGCGLLVLTIGARSLGFGCRPLPVQLFAAWRIWFSIGPICFLRGRR